ncbi:MFS transporter [Intrasporangium sp.]|uniref:MFS transporter n=1 Tax=Intrasporangium sp. TaxID=1925024 RepID=UPI00293B2239|nr:MFS transporter [Intrasporangium sp.]MDV3220854.1 MFS transporter [Intrasporangium sp.]
MSEPETIREHEHQPERTAPEADPYPRRWRLLALLGVAQFMLILDVTVVAVALPEIASGLALDRAALTWVVSAYTLAFGALMLVGGRSADLYGSRAVVLAGLSLFTAASLTAGLAPDATVLVAARAAQGVGAALLSPAALSVVTKVFSGAELGRALGVWSALGGAGSAVGVLLGGVLTGLAGWQWVFFVNVPVGAVVIVLLLRSLPGDLPRASSGRLDPAGAVLVTAATGAAVFGLIGAGDRGWAAPVTLSSLAGAIVLYGLLAVWLRRASAPLLDPRILGRPVVRAGLFLLFVATGLMLTVFFLGTFYLQDWLGHGPIATGLMFLPVALATTLGAQTAGRVVSTRGPRQVAVVGLSIAAAGLVVPALASGAVAMVSAVSLGSLGLGAVFVAASTVALSTVDHAEAGLVSGLLSTSHELGATFGVAVMSSVAAASLAAAASGASGASGAGGDRGGFVLAFGVAALVAAISAVGARWIVPPSAGAA